MELSTSSGGEAGRQDIILHLERNAEDLFRLEVTKASAVAGQTQLLFSKHELKVPPGNSAGEVFIGLAPAKFGTQDSTGVEISLQT